jgi:hypothetical protein
MGSHINSQGSSKDSEAAFNATYADHLRKHSVWTLEMLGETGLASLG